MLLHMRHCHCLAMFDCFGDQSKESRRCKAGAPRHMHASGGAHLEKVFYHVPTKGGCDRSAVFKAWTGIDFNEPSLEALINDKVIPKQLMGATPLLQGILQSLHWASHICILVHACAQSNNSPELKPQPHIQMKLMAAM